MPITGLPTFSAGILTAAQLNAIVTALESKFAGQIVSGDLSWPLTAGGDIDMAQFQLLNVSKFWNAYNAAERPAGTTLQSLIDSVSTDGGGIVVIPGNFTEAVPAAGITIPTNVHLVGDGESSVLQMHASASAAMVTLGTSSHNSGLINLRLKGVTSVNQIFVDLNSCDYTRVHGCHFVTHGTSAFIKVRASAVGTSIQYNRFTGNGSAQTQDNILLEACTHTRIIHNDFDEWSNVCVRATPVAAAVNQTVVADNDFRRTSTSAAAMTSSAPIAFTNTNAVASAGVIIVDNVVQGEGVSIGGIHVDDFDDVMVVGNELALNIAEPAVLAVDCARVVVNQNIIKTEQGDGIVLGSTNGTEVAAGSRTVGLVIGFVVSSNEVYCSNPVADKGAALIMVGANATFVDGCVTGNRLESIAASTMQLWNLGLAVTSINITIVGNYSVPHSTSTVKGFTPYTDMGVTQGANVGALGLGPLYFTMVANTIPGTLAGFDFTHNAATKTIVQDNNT